MDENRHLKDEAEILTGHTVRYLRNRYLSIPECFSRAAGIDRNGGPAYMCVEQNRALRHNRIIIASDAKYLPVATRRHWYFFKECILCGQDAEWVELDEHHRVELCKDCQELLYRGLYFHGRIMRPRDNPNLHPKDTQDTE